MSARGYFSAVLARCCDRLALGPASDLWFVATRRMQSKANGNELKNSKTTQTKFGTVGFITRKRESGVGCFKFPVS